MEISSIPEIEEAKNQVSGFLEKYGMHYAGIDLKAQIKLFTAEMENGLKGRDSSLKMYPTFIEYNKKLPKNEPVIVLDAGGTNLRSAVFNFDSGNKPVFTKYRKTLMPGLKNEVSKDEFFNTLADSIGDILHESEKIGFVFSYPIEIFPNRDGRLVRFTKEIKAKEVEGQFIGENLMQVIRKRGFKNIKSVVLLNDTVASLLSGISSFQEREFSGYIGFVLGTGMNACYIEKNSNIWSIASSGLPPEAYQLVNIEAGQYLKGPVSKIDMAFDAKTLNPSLSTFEKMFSGAYLGGLAHTVLGFAASDGLFSKKFSGDLNMIEGLDPWEIDDYLYFPPGNRKFAGLLPGMSEKDKVTLYYLFDSLIERAAVLAAIVLAASAAKENTGYNPCAPICIIADGSSFYKMKNFKTRVECCLKEALSKQAKDNNIKRPSLPDMIYHEIHAVDEAILKGAAAAALAQSV